MGPYELLEKVVTGSVASMAYGEPRFTNDIWCDLLVEGVNEKRRTE